MKTKKQYIIKEAEVTTYYKDRKMSIIHREDGPAMEFTNGKKYWYFNGDEVSEDTFKVLKEKPKTISIGGRVFTLSQIQKLIENLK
jgi:beta-lactamase superfamily II metal-dependent hydrolase